MSDQRIVGEVEHHRATLHELHRHMIPASELFESGRYEASLQAVCRTSPVLESLLERETEIAVFRNEIVTIVANAAGALGEVRVEMGWFPWRAQVDRVLATTVPFADLCDAVVATLVARSDAAREPEPALFESRLGLASLVTQVAIFTLDRPAERRASEAVVSAAVACQRRVYERVVRAGVAMRIDPSLFEWADVVETHFPGSASEGEQLADRAVAGWPGYDELGPRTGLPHDWHPDPTGRHEYRYWRGEWTDDVADDGVAAVDPLC